MRRTRNAFDHFLQLDFPCILISDSNDQFWKIADYGRRLRELHLLKGPEISQFSLRSVNGFDASSFLNTPHTRSPYFSREF